MNLTDMTIQELNELKTKIENEIKNREKQNNPTIEISWESDWTNKRKHGKPYLAIITPGTGKYKFDHDFLKTVDEWRKNDCKSMYKGKLPVGTILKARTGGSWKNDYISFYEITDDLTDISEREATKKLGMI